MTRICYALPRGCQALKGDRRLALRRVGNRSGMPRLAAGRLHQRVPYIRQLAVESATAESPIYVRTLARVQLPVFAERL